MSRIDSEARTGPLARRQHDHRVSFWEVVLSCACGVAAACGGNGEEEPDAAVPPDPVTVTGPLGRIDFAYALSLTDEDPTGETRSWTRAGGLLPPGLNVEAGGLVSGTPRASGRYESELWGEGPCGDPSCRLKVYLTVEVAEVILLSGYGPFEGVDVNPSWHAVAPLDGTLIDGYDVRVIELPVVWEEAPALFLAEYDRLGPVLAIGSGVAMGETIVRLESRAINWALGEDTIGVVKDGVRIDEDEDYELFSTLPLESLRVLLEGAGYPVGISDDAGTYLCNYLFFKIMQQVALEPEERHVLGGFVHVTGPEVVTIADMTEAWALILAELVRFHKDLASKRAPCPRQRPEWNVTIHHPPRYEQAGPSL